MDGRYSRAIKGICKRLSAEMLKVMLQTQQQRLPNTVVRDSRRANGYPLINERFTKILQNVATCPSGPLWEFHQDFRKWCKISDSFVGVSSQSYFYTYQQVYVHLLWRREFLRNHQDSCRNGFKNSHIRQKILAERPCGA